MASPPDTSAMTPEQLQAFMNEAAFPPPPGIESQFANPPNNNAAAIATITCSLILTCSFGILYVCSRVAMRKLHISDFLALAAFAVYLALIVRVHDLMSHVGFFVRQWNLQRKQMPVWGWYYNQAIILYIFSAMLIRQAIILQLLSIFVPNGERNVFFWLCQVTFWLNTAYYIATGISIAVPHDYEVFGFGLASSIMNVVFDFVIFFLPQRVIWKLNMPFNKKLGVSFAFALGLLACISAVARAIITGIFFVRHNNSDKPLETTLMNSTVCLLATAEATFGILVFAVTGVPKGLHSLGITKVAEWVSASTERIITPRKSRSRYYNVEHSDMMPLDEMGSGSGKRSGKGATSNHQMPDIYQRRDASSGEVHDERLAQNSHSAHGWGV